MCVCMVTKKLYKPFNIDKVVPNPNIHLPTNSRTQYRNQNQQTTATWKLKDKQASWAKESTSQNECTLCISMYIQPKSAKTDPGYESQCSVPLTVMWHTVIGRWSVRTTGFLTIFSNLVWVKWKIHRSLLWVVYFSVSMSNFHKIHQKLKYSSIHPRVFWVDSGVKIWSHAWFDFSTRWRTSISEQEPSGTLSCTPRPPCP